MSFINKLTRRFGAAAKPVSSQTWPESAFSADQHQLRNSQFTTAYQAILDPQQAFEFCRRQADEGVVQALYLLALQYEQGNGEQTYLPEALACYHRAAQCGHAESLFNLGLLQLQGRQSKPNAVLAFNYFEQAAKLGLAPAQYNLASMLDQGSGCFQDQKAAFSWYNKAAEQGYTQAWNNIAVMYYRGEGVPEDKLLAYAWTLLAAKAGVAEAIAAEPEMTQALSGLQALAGKAHFEHLQLGFVQYLPIDIRVNG